VGLTVRHLCESCACQPCIIERIIHKVAADMAMIEHEAWVNGLEVSVGIAVDQCNKYVNRADVTILAGERHEHEAEVKKHG